MPERRDAFSTPRADNADPLKAPQPTEPKTPASSRLDKDADALPFGAKPADQRVISIPPRPTAAPASNGLNGASPAPAAKNGLATNGSHSPLGERSVGPGLTPVARSLQDRLRESKPLEPLKSEPKPAPTVEAKEPERTEAKPEAAPRAEVTPKATPTPTFALTPEAATPAKPVENAPAALAAAGGAAAGRQAPSEALLDAVVDMVQKDPSSMSVFTSGSAFINGVVEKARAAAPEQAGPVPGQKLDGAAAELLRPMLRQWLAENMPRIVEEALRSELSSSQSTENDPKKS